MAIASLNTLLVNLFINESHHRNLIVIYMVQNVYNQGQSHRIILQNSHFTVVFRNGHEASQFCTMAYQTCPSYG